MNIFDKAVRIVRLQLQNIHYGEYSPSPPVTHFIRKWNKTDNKSFRTLCTACAMPCLFLLLLSAVIAVGRSGGEDIRTICRLCLKCGP